jgi:MFS family permease
MGATGIGALSAALTLAAKKGLKGLGRWVAISSAGFGLSMILFSQSRWFWVSFALLIPLGFSMMLQMSSSNTLIQAMVPDRLRGRVMSVYSMMFMGMAPFGAFFAGALAHHIGAPMTLALGGLGCLAGSATFGVYLPGLRTETRRLIIAQQAAGGDPAQETTAPTGLSG